MLQTDTLQVTLEILKLIARVDEFKGAWRAWVSSRRIDCRRLGAWRLSRTLVPQPTSRAAIGGGRGVWYDLR